MYVISDVHGNIDALHRLLYVESEIDFGRREYTVAIGDLINAVESTLDSDLECLSMIGEEIDLLIVGNHEMPYFDAQNRFAGFHHSSSIAKALQDLNVEGKIAPSYLFGDTLITHAGVTRPQLNIGTGFTAQRVHEKLCSEWNQGNFGHSLFSDVSRARYGRDAYGGVLWCDWQEFEPTDFPQIVGHTPGMFRSRGNSLCIDTIRMYGMPTLLHLEEE